MKDVNIYLKNILDKAHEGIAYCEDMTMEVFLEDEKTQSAVILKLIVIGEEAKKLPDNIKNAVNLPWRMIIGFRNMAVHEYFDIDMSQIWSTIQTDLPQIIKEVSAYLNDSVKN